MEKVLVTPKELLSKVKSKIDIYNTLTIDSDFV